MDYKKIGDLISELRREKGLTQKELADKLYITDRAVSKWERGLGCPDVSLLDDLSRILDISIIEILKGRKLDKDEIIENASIIESMNYSKESFKHKFRKYFNIFCMLTIFFVGSIILINNIKSIYYLNKTYKNIVDYEGLEKTIAETNSYINIIKNNKGKYTDEEYKKILIYVNGLEDDFKFENNSYYVGKIYYKYPELVRFYDIHQNYEYVLAGDNRASFVSTKQIYEILLNHNYNVIDNLTDYNNYTYSINSTTYNLYEALLQPYYYGKNVNDSVANEVNNYLAMRYYRDNELLSIIMKAGEMYE